jgi:hypothetical protein
MTELRTSSPQALVAKGLPVVIINVSPDSSLGNTQGIAIQATLIVGNLKQGLVFCYGPVCGYKWESELRIREQPLDYKAAARYNLPNVYSIGPKTFVKPSRVC